MIGNHFLRSQFLPILQLNLIHKSLQSLAHGDNLLELQIGNLDL